MRGRGADFDKVLRAFAVAGGVALLPCLSVAVVGTATRAVAPFYGSTLRFLVAVLIVSAPYAELIERRARRGRPIPKEQRLGFLPTGLG